MGGCGDGNAWVRVDKEAAGIGRDGFEDPAGQQDEVE